MHITLIRHLPTEWNGKNWLQGSKNIPLAPISFETEKGIEMNLNILQQLSPPDLVLTSELIRTQQTAELYGYAFQVEPLLNELHFGKFEGRPKKDLLTTYGEQWLFTPRELILGEKLVDFEKRIKTFIAKYMGLYQHLLIFGHGTWIRAFLSIIKHGSINGMNQITVSNNELISIQWPSRRG